MFRFVSRALGNAARTARTAQSFILKKWTSALFPELVWGKQSVVRSGVRLSLSGSSKVQIGARVALDRNALLAARDGEVQIGDDTYIGVGVVIVARERIVIGRHVLIAEYTSIRDQNHIYGVDTLTSKSGFRTAPIVIGNNVWIGAKVTITKGVTIGDNAVIGANAVVTDDVPPGAVAVGVPARVIRQLS